MHRVPKWSIGETIWDNPSLSARMSVSVGVGVSLSVGTNKFFGMFDFEKLEVYQKLRSLNARLLPEIFKIQKTEVYLTDQLKRASLSALLNLSEGTGRMTAADKKQFYIRARASVFESVSILQVLADINLIKEDFYHSMNDEYEQVSKMLLAMIRSLK